MKLTTTHRNIKNYITDNFNLTEKGCVKQPFFYFPFYTFYKYDLLVLYNVYMKKFCHYVEYLGLRFLIFILGLMPENTLIKFGEFMGIVLTKIMPNRYKRSVSDIQKAFPNKTEKECKQIAKESWSNIGRIVTEFAKAIHASKEEILSKFRFENCDQFFKDNQEGKGGILLLGHFANWETLGLAAAIKAKKMAFVAYPQRNQYVNEYISKLRKRFGSTLISSHNPFFASFRALKKGALVAVLADQSVISSKFYMNFLNRPAEVSPMPAVLSLKTGVPVYCLEFYRYGDKLVAHCSETIYPPKVEYSTASVADFTKVLQSKLEKNVLDHPNDWLWAHNRWKREAEARKALEEGKVRAD